MKITPFLKKNGKFQLYDRLKCEFISPNIYDEIIVGSQTTTCTVKNNNRYGILNNEGVQIIDCSYDLAQGFDKNGLARVKINQRFGFINMENVFVIPPVHEYLSDFYNGLSCATVNGKSKFIDTTGNFISQKEYEETSIFWDERCSVKINGKWGLIDKDERIIINPLYDSLFEENKICRVEQNGKYFLIDLENNPISEYYDYIDHLCEGTYQVSREGYFGHIKNTGEALTPMIYENCTDFHGEFAGVYLKGKWSFIDRGNTQIVESNKYNLCDILGGIEDGIAVVSNENGWGLIDLKSDKLVTDFIYDFSWGISGGLCSFLKDSKWGYIDKKGIERIDFKYSDPGYFEDSIARVAIKEKSFQLNSSQFYIDVQGTEFREKNTTHDN